MAAYRTEGSAEIAQRGGAGALANGGAAAQGAAPPVAGVAGPNRTLGVLQWLAAETRGSYKFGDLVNGVGAIAEVFFPMALRSLCSVLMVVRSMTS